MHRKSETVRLLFGGGSFLFVSLSLLVCPLRSAETDVEKTPKEEKPQFLRVQKNEAGEPTLLETAIVRYTSADGKQHVDLIAAVHVADAPYYKQLNEEFNKYDAMLYELVAPRGTRVPKGGKPADNPIALIQGLTRSALALELQTEKIDYSPENFVHADMSPEELAEAMNKRGETGLSLMLSVLSDAVRQQNLEGEKEEEPAEELDPIALLIDPAGSLKVKRIMAEQFATLEDPSKGLGKALDQLLVQDRNAAAVKILKEELAKEKKQLALFYGAAHMADFDRRLTEELGFHRGETRWLAAWSMKEGGKTRSLLEGLLEELGK